MGALQAAIDAAKGLKVRARLKLLADRRHLERAILPRFAEAAADPAFGPVLFVGVAFYTKNYFRAFEEAGARFLTAEVDPSQAAFGSPHGHATVDVRHLERAYSPDSLGAVLLNGVFGWGLDDADGMNAALASIHRVLKPGGLLLVGWDVDRVPDPLTLEALAPRFAHGPALGLPAREELPSRRYRHVYDFFAKI